MLIGGILNQVVYPGAGDVDDCWVVATIQAVLAASKGATKPTVPEFRKAAHKPDNPHKADGGNLTAILDGIRGIWPKVVVIEFRAASFYALKGRLVQSGTASVAVHSGYLPSRLQFGFRGLHQVAIELSGGTWYLANPLAPQGSHPLVITENELRAAISGYSSAGVFAAYFPLQEGAMATTITPIVLTGTVSSGGKPVDIYTPDGQKRTLVLTDFPADADTYTIAQSDNRAPHGSPFRRLAARPNAGWYVQAGIVTFKPAG